MHPVPNYPDKSQNTIKPYHMLPFSKLTHFFGWNINWFVLLSHDMVNVKTFDGVPIKPVSLINKYCTIPFELLSIGDVVLSEQNVVISICALNWCANNKTCFLN